ncbi:50S ribosomal protein L2 [Candidatus Omnitrophus magneticus]|uniref:Large ribosomal subunit protein uL2 n=1 Tax=Candidatus Omnitrophus magneticus TaxID=1609969 RepID=A0A0F0CLX5_9BACT|nr:50S ribosomal protein L2 [Candidatus Omnitrophus magneticus]
MGIRKYGTFSPSSRWATNLDFSDITKTKPEKSLTTTLRKTGGRNNNGRKTVSSKGGGHKRRYRIIDFFYLNKGKAGIIEAIEYDPNRTANIAFVKYDVGQKGYIIAPVSVAVGTKIESSNTAKIEIGNSTELKNIPLGTMVHCVEFIPGKGAKIARSAGMGAIVLAKDNGIVHLKMPSGEVRLVSEACYATIGQVGNIEYENIVYGNAGRIRHLGVRPKSRAVVKNPVDHPMGGGEGKSSGGRHPCTPWGKITKGLKTRHKKKASDRKIVKRRKS